MSEASVKRQMGNRILTIMSKVDELKMIEYGNEHGVVLNTSLENIEQDLMNAYIELVKK